MKKIEIKKIHIKTTHDERVIRILLPDDYETSDRLYPVLYMHDGQNLFEDSTAYGNHSWNIYEILKDLDVKMIVVGVDNSVKRFEEYSPWASDSDFFVEDKTIIGGKGDLYADFFVHDLVPMIERDYRVIKDRSSRYIAGSSMGAFISVYIALRYNQMFSFVGVFSLASWFNEKAFLDYVKHSEVHLNQSYFISIGRHETSSTTIENFNEIYIQNSKNLRDLLTEKGIQNILYIETDDTHNELAWRKVFPKFVTFINKKST